MRSRIFAVLALAILAGGGLAYGTYNFMHPSPRVIAIPLFDPVFYDTGKRNGRTATLKFVNYLGFFVERMQGNDVVGEITPIGGLRNGGFGPANETAFPRAIRLVQ